MNFQAVSVGQKLPVGGYKPDLSPSDNLADAIAHTDRSIGRMVDALEDHGLWKSTLIIISAKHGQSPIDRSKLAMEKDAPVPNNTVQDPGDFIDFSRGGRLQTDDVGLVWLQDQSKDSLSQAVDHLKDNAAAIHATVLPPRTIFTSNIVSGDALADIYGDPTSGDRVAHARAPNVFIQPDEGVIYSGSSKKIAEHGGGAPGDTEVALLVAGGRVRPGVVKSRVFTTQVAPTILEALGLEPEALKAVRKEHTRSLPGLEPRER
jgi:arylsulfatase A-like enzyme